MKKISKIIVGIFIIIILLTILFGFEGLISGLIFGFFSMIILIIKKDALTNQDGEWK